MSKGIEVYIVSLYCNFQFVYLKFCCLQLHKTFLGCRQKISLMHVIHFLDHFHSIAIFNYLFKTLLFAVEQKHL